jgi:ribosomal protein L16 Arg81 hydroxylase
VRSALSDITRSRTIVGHTVPGYVNAEQVRADFAAGATFKLNQPEHWHPRLQALVAGLAPSFQAELESYVFLSPPDRTAIETHMDGSHVFVLQVAGRKDWTVGLLDADSLACSDRYRGAPLTDQTALRVTLEPGDVLYMPHGSPHHATARDGNSIHVAVTVEEPGVDDLAKVLLAGAVADDRFAALEQDFHRRRPAQNTQLLRSLVVDALSAASSSAALERAVDLRRSHWT